MSDTAENTRVLNGNPFTELNVRRIVRVATVNDVNDLAALDPNRLEALLNNWHGRKETA